MQTGIISRVYGAYYNLRPLDAPDQELSGQLRGRLRLESRATKKKAAQDPYGDGMQERHLLIVGDHVQYSEQKGGPRAGHNVVIESLDKRRNSVYRSTASELHALGANLDRAIVLISLSQPRPRWGFLDRFLAACYAGDVPAHIVFSKPDLIDDADRADLERMIDLYRAGLGYGVSVLDLVREEPRTEIEALLGQVRSGVTLLAGQSGTGKSTLMNLLLGGQVQETGSISASTGKGRHTTTNSRLMVSEDLRMFLIDTPGVKEWGVQHLSAAEILASYPEINAVIGECRFNDCAHQPEQDGCAVLALLERSRETYAEYFLNIEEIEENPDVAVPSWSAEFVHPERLRSLSGMLDSLQYDLRIRTGDFIKPTGRLRKDRITPDDL